MTQLVTVFIRVRFCCMLALVTFLFSCTKDKVMEIAPVISIESPAKYQSYSVSDTITVKAMVTHAAKIDFVSVVVVNEGLTPVLPLQEFIPSVNEFILETDIAIENQLLESGKYFVRVRAGAGNQTTTEWVEISITASERLVESILAVCSDQNNGFRLYDIDKNWAIKQRFSFGGDYLGSAFDARTQMFYTCGNIFGSLNAWELDENLLIWSLAPLANPPLPYFTQIFSSEEEVYVATRDAYITGYNATGMSVFKTPLYTNGYFREMVRYKSRLISVFEPFNATFNNLIVFNYPGGTFFQSLLYQGSVVKIVNYGNDGQLVFMNIEGGSAIYHYQFDDNRLVMLKQFELGQISSVTMSGENYAFIAVPGAIYWYRPADNSLVKYVSVSGVNSMADDYQTNRLYVATGRDIDVYQWPSETPERTIVLPWIIEDLHLRYNR